MGISIKDVDVSSVSPMMQHYIKTKEEYEDSIGFSYDAALYKNKRRI